VHLTHCRRSKRKQKKEAESAAAAARSQSRIEKNSEKKKKPIENAINTSAAALTRSEFTHLFTTGRYVCLI
jgi:hypothetical protein